MLSRSQVDDSQSLKSEVGGSVACPTGCVQKMVKLATTFTDVNCPVCGNQIDCRVDKASLVRHIKDEHPTTSTRQLVRTLFQELKLSMPEKIDEVSGEELYELLASLYLYKSTKLGLNELRRKIRGK